MMHTMHDTYNDWQADTFGQLVFMTGKGYVQRRTVARIRSLTDPAAQALGVRHVRT